MKKHDIGSETLPDEKQQLRYDRQIHAMGLAAVTSMLHASYLILGLDCTGTEIARNLVLSGCKTIFLCDDAPVDHVDVTSTYFYTDADVGLLTRSHVLAPLLRALDPDVTIEVVDEPELPSSALTSSTHQLHVRGTPISAVVAVNVALRRVCLDPCAQASSRSSLLDVFMTWNRVFGAAGLTTFQYVSCTHLVGAICNDFGDVFRVDDVSWQPLPPPMLVARLYRRADGDESARAKHSSCGQDEQQTTSRWSIELFAEKEHREFLSPPWQLQLNAYDGGGGGTEGDGATYPSPQGMLIRSIAIENAVESPIGARNQVVVVVECTVSKTVDTQLCSMRDLLMQETTQNGSSSSQHAEADSTPPRRPPSRVFAAVYSDPVTTSFSRLAPSLNACNDNADHNVWARMGGVENLGSAQDGLCFTLLHLAERYSMDGNSEAFSGAMSQLASTYYHHHEHEEGSGSCRDNKAVELLRRFRLFPFVPFHPLCSFIGAIAAQELMKAMSHKHLPLTRGWGFDARFLLDVVATTPKTTSANPTPTTTLDSGVNPLEVIFGNSFRDELEGLYNAKVFLVGAGAIGCEYLKHFATLGIGAGKSGRIDVVDSDHIEVSNLSRQFLFGVGDVQKSKAATAIAAVRKKCPRLKCRSFIKQLDAKSVSEAGSFKPSFMRSQQILCGAVDNNEARLLLDELCGRYEIPFIDAGTMGPHGHVMTVVPYVTERLSSSRAPETTTSIPFCTLHFFPTNITHCVQWAVGLFSSLFSSSSSACSSSFGNDLRWKVEVMLDRQSTVEDKVERICGLLLEQAAADALKNNVVLLDSNAKRLAGLWMEEFLFVKDYLVAKGNIERSNKEDDEALAVAALMWARREFDRRFVLPIMHLMKQHPLVEADGKSPNPYWRNSNASPVQPGGGDDGGGGGAERIPPVAPRFCPDRIPWHRTFLLAAAELYIQLHEEQLTMLLKIHNGSLVSTCLHRCVNDADCLRRIEDAHAQNTSYHEWIMSKEEEDTKGTVQPSNNSSSDEDRLSDVLLSFKESVYRMMLSCCVATTQEQQKSYNACVDDADTSSTIRTTDAEQGQTPPSVRTKTTGSIQFDKDNPLHVSFVAAASNIRAASYRIPAGDTLDVKRIAGRIIPAMMTTTSAVTSFAVMQLIGLFLAGGGQSTARCNDVNLALHDVMLTFQMECSRAVRRRTTVMPSGQEDASLTCRPSPYAFTAWEKWWVRVPQDITFVELVRRIRESHGGVDITQIVDPLTSQCVLDLNSSHHQNQHQGEGGCCCPCSFYVLEYMQAVWDSSKSEVIPIDLGCVELIVSGSFSEVSSSSVPAASWLPTVWYCVDRPLRRQRTRNDDDKNEK